MRKKILGFCPEENLKHWSETAIDCYNIGAICSKCSLPNDIKKQCEMKKHVLNLVKFLGAPKRIEAETLEEILSAREYEILSLMAQGLSDEEIEKQLCISHATVRNHIGSIFQRLNIETSPKRVKAVLRYIEEVKNDVKIDIE